MSFCLLILVGLLVPWFSFVHLPVCLDSEVLRLSVRLFGLSVVFCWFWDIRHWTVDIVTLPM